jgi:uncharacterized protein YndB with AHSA1/START domain
MNDDFASVISPTEIRFERLLPGPIETVWAFHTDSQKRGERLASGRMDLRVGGKMELRFEQSDLSPNKAPPPERFRQTDATGHRSEETITEIEAPRHLAFTWGNSEVVFDLAPREGKVLLVLTHRKLANRTDTAGFAGGWHCHLAILADKAHGHVPPAFWDVFRQFDGEYDRRIPRSCRRVLRYIASATFSPDVSSPKIMSWLRPSISRLTQAR